MPGTHNKLLMQVRIGGNRFFLVIFIFGRKAQEMLYSLAVRGISELMEVRYKKINHSAIFTHSLQKVKERESRQQTFVEPSKRQV